MEPVMLDSHLTHFAEEGTFQNRVKVTLAYSADYVEGEEDKDGSVLQKAHKAIRKRYTVAKGKSVLIEIQGFGSLELVDGDTIDLHRTVNDRTVGVAISRNWFPASQYGRLLAISCRAVKSLQPK